MALFVLLLAILSQSSALARGLRWQPLESLRELEENDLVLCLTTIPWSGQARSFKIRFLELLIREKPKCAEILELRHVDLHGEKDSKFGFGRSLVLYRSGKAFEYKGSLSAERVLAAVEYALSYELSDLPFQSLHTASDLQRFVDSTDRAFVLVDLCGWTLNRGGIVEDYEKDEANFPQLDSSLYEPTNETYEICSRSNEQEFATVYRNLTETARTMFLTPEKARLGLITTRQVLEDSKIKVLTDKPWVLMRRMEDIVCSWEMIYDAARLENVFKNTAVVVDEMDRDSDIPYGNASVFLFISRGSYLPDVRNESISALRTLRKVARHYAGLHTWKTVPEDLRPAPAVNEERPVSLRGVLVKDGRTITLGQKDLREGIAGILQLLLQNKGEDSSDNTVIPDQDNETFLTGERIDDKTIGAPTAEAKQGQDEEVSGTGLEHEITKENQEKNDQEKMEEQKEANDDQSGFNFGYFEDAYVLQELVTGGPRNRPSLVAVIPKRNAYYVYPENSPLSFTAVVEFLEGAHSGALQPTTKSSSASSISRKVTRPPFVNRDFHRENAVPSLTLDLFAKKVMRIGSDLRNSSKRASNSLVLFTLPWCGFCKRMELAMHEAYKQFLLSSDNEQNLSFYQMDCTANDCSHILTNVLEEQEFPSLLFFPFVDKDSPLVYKGSPTVNGILRFIASYGTSNFGEPSTIRIQKTDEPLQQNERILVGHVLLATQKFSGGSSNFEDSAILIVSVIDDHIMGLIINKEMEWEQLSSVEQLQNVKKSHLGYGGPLYEHPKHLFSLTRLQNLAGFGVISYDLYAGGPSATEKVFELIEGNSVPPSEFMFFAGHCGWSPQQLQDELAAGYWQLTQFREDMLQWGTSNDRPDDLVET